MKNDATSQKSSSKGLWIDLSNAEEWARVCQKEIAAWLSVLWGEEPGYGSFAQSLSLEVAPPTRKQAERAYDQNTTLRGEIGFRWFDETVPLSIPMSYHGAFLYEREESRHPLVSVWPSWLAERRAFRVVNPTDPRKRSKGILEWRIGLPDGRWVSAKLDEKGVPDLSSKPRERIKKHLYLGEFEEWPEWLRTPLEIYGPRGTAKKGPQAPSRAWMSIHRLILEKYNTGDYPEVSDEDDLDHRILVTFPVWLKNRITAGTLAAVLPRSKSEPEEWRKEVVAVLRGMAPGYPDLAIQARAALWESLESLGAKINWAINNYRSDERADYIDPINSLDLAARITRVRRIHRPASRLEEQPAEFRQVHPSFEGKICPVESPESGQVGLTVQMASGASADFSGNLTESETVPGRLGIGAGLVPFLAHNDGPRNMMGAKNLRQAIPLRKSAPPIVTTGGEKQVADYVKPLVDLGLCPQPDEAAFYAGRDLLVAYLPWHGMNFEDAVVIGQHVVDAGMLDCAGLSKVKRKPIKLGWVPMKPENSEKIPGLKDGLIPVGSRVTADTPIACFGWEGRERARQIVVRYKDRTPAIVKRIEFHRRNEWTGGILEYEIETPIPIRPGDKLMGRHGNKGVVGTILPEDQMPRLPDALGGQPIDILLNPHGVISRMNLGQLIETHVGWLLHRGGFSVNDLCKPGSEAGSDLAIPFADVLDHDKVQAALEQSGLDRYGRTQITLPSGDQTIAPVVVGYQHIVRLRHIPELKAQARRGGQDATYSTRTGQAIHGKKFGGGQRLGEMEVWALAAHKADAVLAEMLGIKSSQDMIIRADKGGTSQGPANYTGYSRVLKDWLFAMGIELAEEGDDVLFRFPAPKEVIKRIGKENQVTMNGGLESRVAAVFKCGMGKRHPCTYELLDGEKIEFKPSRNSKEPTLTLGQFLSHVGFRPDGKLKKKGTHYEVLLVDKYTGTRAATLEITFECITDTVRGVARFTSAASTAPASREELESLATGMAEAQLGESSQLGEIYLHGRFGRKKEDAGKGKNYSAEELLAQFQEEEAKHWWKPAKQRKRCVTDMVVACPHHRHQGVRGALPYGQVHHSTSGGLFDPRIFGHWAQGFHTADRWGYIELPIPVKFPLHVLVTHSRKPQGQERAVSKFLEACGKSAGDIPELTCIPVLPTHYRIPTHGKDKMIRNDLERQGYLPLLSACRRYREAIPEDREKHRKNIERQVERLFQQLISSIEKKSGLIRRDGLGRRVDRSARLVVTPNPYLGWDQVGIPTPALVELIGDQVEQWQSDRNPEEATRNPLPRFSTKLWAGSSNEEEAIHSAQVVIKAFLKEKVDFVVLLNRQPSLHRDSFQAFRPIPLPMEAGDVIQLCPLACKGFAADFDGDEMVVHVPLGETAQSEARRLLPSNNLFSLATVDDDAENVLAHYDQDFVMGTWFLGASDEVRLHRQFKEILPDEACRQMVSKWNHPRKKDGQKLLAKLAHEHTKEAPRIIAGWMNLAFEACSRAGVSFGYYELRELANEIQPKVTEVCREAIDPEKPSKINDVLSDLTQPVLEDTVKPTKSLSSPGYAVAAMALSGARGKKQVRQLISARGFLDPGKTGFDPSAYGLDRFCFDRSLVDGLTCEQAFWASMNGRSSMVDKKLGTGYAGGLTRSMVFALWSYAIVSEDCGSTEENDKRGPATCRAEGGCCAKCYGGLPPEGKLPPIGFPAGLIAAQSIGERGTQLSMQSFHAGESKIDIHAVRGRLNPSMGGIGSLENFLKFMKKAEAYDMIQKRHMEILWRVVYDSSESILRSAIQDQDSVTRLAHRQSRGDLAEAVFGNSRSRRHSPFARVLLGGIKP